MSLYDIRLILKAGNFQEIIEKSHIKYSDMNNEYTNET